MKDKISISISITIILVLLAYIIYVRFLKKKCDRNYNITPNYSTSDIKLVETDTKKKNILFFMSIDYPTIPEYGLTAIQSIKDYCSNHGYTFQLNHYNKSELDIPPYWVRVRDLKRYLYNTDFEYVVYFDLDVIINPRFKNTSFYSVVDGINSETGNVWDMYIPLDPPRYRNDAMNVGIMVVKNTEWSRKFVSLWFDNFPKGSWKKKTDNGWECKDCSWSGDEYEQGMLNRMCSRDILDSKKHVIPVDDTLMGNMEPNHVDYTFIYHFMGYNDKKRNDMMKRLAN